jgi:hypothetical protein
MSCMLDDARTPAVGNGALGDAVQPHHCLSMGR